MANTSISNLATGAAVSATDLFPDVQTVGVGPVKVTAAQLKTFMGASPTLTAPVTLNGVVGSSAFTINGATQTASFPVFDATQTWNNAATTFTGFKFNVTDTASNAASLLMDLQTGGTSRFNIRKDSNVSFTTWMRLGGSETLSWNGQIFEFARNTSVSPGFSVSMDGTYNIKMASVSNFGFTASNASGATALDTILTRRAAANLRFGAADAAAPVAQTLSVQSVVAGTSNTAGANLTITGSQGTGTGVGGSIIFQTAPAGSSGTAQNALATALIIDSAGMLDFGGSTSSFPALSRSGTTLQVRLADNSADAPLSAASGTFSTITANTNAIVSSGYSLTGSSAVSMVDLSGTWNTSGTPTAIKLNITDTASNASSLLMDLQVGGSSKFKVDKTGAATTVGNSFTLNPTSGNFSISYPNVAGVNGQDITIAAQNNTSGNFGGGQLYLKAGSAQGAGIAGSIWFYPQNTSTSVILTNVGNTYQDFRQVAGSTISWVSGTSLNVTPDLILTRRGAANLNLGAADAAAPVAQTLSVQSVVAGTSNTAGANFTINGSIGTGTGQGGSIIFQVAPAGGSGTAQNALSAALTLSGNRNLTGAGTATFNGGALTVSDGSSTFLSVTSTVTGNLFEVINSSVVTVFAVDVSGNTTLADAANLAFGTTTGTKIGTATSQKIGFWNAAPIAQPTTAVAAATVAATGTGDVVAASTTFDGYTIPQIVKALRNAGLLA